VNRDDLQSAYDDAGSISELARRLGITYRVARYRLEKQGVETKKRAPDARAPEMSSSEWQRLYDEAPSASALARHLGTTRPAVLYQLRKHGITVRRTGYKSPKSITHTGADNPNWKGGTYRHAQGYIYELAPNHPEASKAKGYVLQHRLVMERHLGRLLTPDEIVHHVNEVKDDNRIENLEVTNRSSHIKRHKAAAIRSVGGQFA